MNLGLGISFVFNQEEPDGSFCTQCNHLIVTKINHLFVSVDDNSELGFELIKTKIKLCEPCKIEYESHSIDQPSDK